MDDVERKTGQAIGSAETAGSNPGQGNNGNPNPAPAGRTGSGNPGRTRPSKEKSSQEILGLSLTPVPELNIPAAPVAGTPAPKAPKRKGEPALDKTLEANVRALTVAGFGLVDKALANPLPVWTISDEEATSISTPLTKILQRLGASETMNKYADYIALTVAAAIITIPRVMIQNEISKARQAAPAQMIEAPQATKEVKKNERKKATAETTINQTSRANSSDPTAVSGNLSALFEPSL